MYQHGSQSVRRMRILLAVLASSAILLEGCSRDSSDPLPATPDPSEELLRRGSALQATPFIHPGVRQPAHFATKDVTVPPTTEIIGVIVDKEARAYIVSDLAGMTTHVINDLIADRPVSITYCNRTNVARVFSSGTTETIELNVGGWKQNQMLIQYEGQMFEHLSADVPLTDYPFERTSFIEWTLKHPTTRVISLTKSKNGP